MKQLLNRLIDKLLGTDKIVEEFERDFPGKCLICSSHWYGITHGHCHPREPVSTHYCIEEMRRWRKQPCR